MRIWAPFAQVLDLLEDYMRWKAFPVERIDGRIRGAARQVIAGVQWVLGFSSNAVVHQGVGEFCCGLYKAITSY